VKCLWHVRQWWSRLVGAVGCWRRKRHEPVWTVGFLAPLLDPSGVEPYWEIAYCLGCGETLTIAEA